MSFGSRASAPCLVIASVGSSVDISSIEDKLKSIGLASHSVRYCMNATDLRRAFLDLNEGVFILVTNGLSEIVPNVASIPLLIEMATVNGLKVYRVGDDVAELSAVPSLDTLL